jgi:hypothetical protein
MVGMCVMCVHGGGGRLLDALGDQKAVKQWLQGKEDGA